MSAPSLTAREMNVLTAEIENLLLDRDLYLRFGLEIVGNSDGHEQVSLKLAPLLTL